MNEQQTINTLKDLYNNESELTKDWQDMTILVINEYEELAKKTGNPIPIQITALKIALGVEE
jgi:RNA polymerase subunit RPABC4/transcription elongation factor Spt4